MGKIRRGNFFFMTWIGDHGYHVHVLKDDRLILKWDLEKNCAIKGKPTKKILKIIRQLKEEGKL